MGYIDDNLLTGEYVMYRTRLHWIVFFWPIVWLFIAIMLFGESGVPSWVGAVILVMGLITGIKSYIRYVTSEFGVTNKRVLVKFGWIRRDALEIVLDKVEGIRVNQGIWGRILNYGSIVISGSGGSREVFPRITAPILFRQKVQEQVSMVQRPRYL